MKRKARWIIFSILLLFFIVITILLLSDKLYNFDTYIYNLLISFESKNLTSYFKIITVFANTKTIIILLVLSLFLKSKDSLYLVITVIISTIINQVLKYLIQRPRPILINKIVESGYSFPSGHAMASVSFYGFIIYLIIESNLNIKIKWITSILLTILIISICLSRIYLGVHFASDVIAGVLLSSSLLLITTYILKGKRI
ncbi:MAG: phosphatase PAP2 family protein [Bacilli bacterium]|nr:phosphatase PAP2 family protein [Bacilli bacterium]MDD4795995.1 phosphatase PAP2 family protein [Bacilli bacterium]